MLNSCCNSKKEKKSDIFLPFDLSEMANDFCSVENA